MSSFGRICFRLVLVLYLSGAGWSVALNAKAQANPQDANPPANISTPHQLRITGCLRRGNDPGTFSITDEHGTTWELISGSPEIDLTKHIFHSVAMTGKEVAQPTSQANSPQGSAAHHVLRVLTLEVLSRSCTR